MSTYLEIQNRINSDYLNRTTFGSETKRAILAAVRHYERERWTFNTTSTAVTASSSQTFVTMPTNLLSLDDLRLTINGESLDLTRRDPQWIRDNGTAKTYGPPTDYAIYQNRFEMFPIPDSAYSLPCFYIKRLDVLSADADTNAWTTDMEDLIVFHAAKLMWANVLRKDSEAMKFAALEKDAYAEAQSYRMQHFLTRLKSTRF